MYIPFFEKTFVLMKIRLSLLSCIVLLLAACGGGSSTSDQARAKENNFVGTQTITLSNTEISVVETDNFTLKVDELFVTVVDADFNATGTLNSDNQFVVSSPIFSTTSDAITCSGSVTYNGQIAGSNVSGSIEGEFNCSGTVFDVSGEFSLR